MAVNLQPHLEQIYENESRQSAYNGASSEEFIHWQNSARAALSRLLGIGEKPAPPIGSTLVRSRQCKGYEEEQWHLLTDDSTDINCYVLKPDGHPPYTPVLVFHGHDPSIEYCLGIYPDEETSAKVKKESGNYAQALAQSGYLVCVAEQRGFGERTSDGFGQAPGRPWTDRHLFFSYLLQGRVLQGERVKDGMTVLQWILQRNDVNSNKLACTGQSGGGTTSIYLSALEDRISVVIPGCAFSSYKESILNTEFGHCECNYIPGILNHFESGDIVSLIAPRPLCLISGKKDHIFPIHAAREQFQIVQKAYATLGVEDRCEHFVHENEHMYHIPACERWIRRWTGV